MYGDVSNPVLFLWKKLSVAYWNATDDKQTTLDLLSGVELSFSLSTRRLCVKKV